MPMNHEGHKGHKEYKWSFWFRFVSFVPFAATILFVAVCLLADLPRRTACGDDALPTLERLPQVPPEDFPYSAPLEPNSTPGGQRRERYHRERLIDRATDPTAWLMEYHFRDQWLVPTGSSGTDENQFQFRPTIPFLVFDQVNIFRAEINYDIESTSGSGLHDVKLFDVLIFEEHWGRWGVGPSIQLLPNATSGDEFAIGPAGVAACKSTHWTVGFILENFFSDSDSQSYVEPILAYKFDDRWSLSVGEMKLRYDWRADAWTQLPLGLSLAYISTIRGQKIRWFVNPAFNFRNSSGGEEWMFNVGLDLLAPDA